MDSPRIPPLNPDELDDGTRHVLGIRPGRSEQPLNIFLTLVRHRELFDAWLPFGTMLLAKGTLPARDRELLILRTGFNCGSGYEWGQHARISRAIGISDEEIARVADGPTASGWDPFDATLLRVADELHNDSFIADATWAALAERYDEHQLTEVCMLVGQYHMVAYALNSLGVQPEPGLEPLP